MKNKIILLSDRTTEYFLYLLIFFVSCSNAGVEICFTFAITAWMINKFARLPLRPLSRLLPSTELNKPLLAFVLANAIAVITSVNFNSSIRPFFSKVLEYVFIFLIVVDTINTRKRIRNLLAVVIFSGFFISIDAGVQYFRGVDFLCGHPISGQRLTVSFGSSNDFGGWLVVLIFIILGLLLNRQPGKFMLRRLGLGILAFFLLFCLGLTYSRGAWLGFLVGLIIIAGYKVIRLPKRAKVLSVLLIIVLAVGIFFLLPSTIKERIVSMGAIRDSSLIRLRFWQESLSIIEDFPIFGAGLNTYMAVSSRYSIPAGGGGKCYPHNAYLHMAAEIGLVGLCCFLWILTSWYRLVTQALRKDADPLLLGLLAGISAFLVHSFFDTNLYSLRLAVLFWFMLGLSVSVQRIMRPLKKVVPATTFLKSQAE